MRISMLLSNAFRPDPRVAREASALAEAGYPVSIIAWDRQAQLSPDEDRDGYHIERLQSVNTAYGAGLRQLFYTPRFWMQAVRRVAATSPDVVHCHDLDTLPAGWWLKRTTGVKIVYDAHENYPAMMSLYLPRPAVAALSTLERYLMHSADQVITASSVLESEFRRLGYRQVVTIGNHQKLEPFDAITPQQIEQARAALELEDQDLVIAYIGGFSRNRLIVPLIQAAAGLPNVQVLIWGDGHQRQMVEKEVANVRNARYLGWLPADQVPLSTCAADVIFYCLEPDYAGAIYNAPNTLSNAMAAGRPVIANDVGDLGKIVHTTGCGILLEDTHPETIRRAIQSLQSEPFRHSLGLAGRQAAEAKYNWSNARQYLLDAYNHLQTK